MGFETKVLQVVEQVVGKAHTAAFAFGTLFVNTFDTDEALRLRDALANMTNAKVIMTYDKRSLEYAYDFV